MMNEKKFINTVNKIVSDIDDVIIAIDRSEMDDDLKKILKVKLDQICNEIGYVMEDYEEPA